MAWVTPKTDWKSSDYYSIDDIQRIINNTEYLRDLINNTLGTIVPTLTNLDVSRGINTLPYYTMINDLEANITAVKTSLTSNWNLAQITWYARTSISYDHNPSYLDWNRWEQLTQDIYDSIIKLNNSLWYSNEIGCGEQ